jgi:hypothetical protein
LRGGVDRESEMATGRPLDDMPSLRFSVVPPDVTVLCACPEGETMQTRLPPLLALVAIVLGGTTAARANVVCVHNGPRGGALRARDVCRASENELGSFEALQVLLKAIASADGGATLRVSGINVQIVSGSGATDGATNGRGNLVVGYNASNAPHDRSGSHNLVVGDEHSYSSYGGLVAGLNNTSSGPYTSICGGDTNTASGFAASVTGGAVNVASGPESSVSGGEFNTASGINASVCGGWANLASGDQSAVSGGFVNKASGLTAWVGGGETNEASAERATVTGGSDNRATAQAATVSGGVMNHADGQSSSVSGGGFNQASGQGASISGGDSNVASGAGASVSGGQGRSAPGRDNWAAGSLLEAN